MKQKRLWLAIILIAGSEFCVLGQTTVPSQIIPPQPLSTNATPQLIRSLEDLFRTADAHNASIRSYETAIQEAAENTASARHAWRPDVEASASVSYLGNVKIWDRPLKNKFSATTPHFGNNFALLARQTVYSGGAITSNIHLAQLSHELAEASAEENRQRVRFLITGHYLQLHNLRNQEEVFNQNIALMEEVIRQTQQRKEQGITLQNDITRHELQLEQLRLGRVRVQDAQGIIRHQLLTALGIDTALVVLEETYFSTALCSTQDEATWQQEAALHHMGLRKADIGTHMAEQRVQLERSERLPKIALVAEDHFDGPVTFEIPTLDKNINYWFVGVGVNYTFSALWKNHKKLQQARTAVQHSKDLQREAREGVENAIQAAYANYQTSFTELATQQKSVELATQNYSIIQNRYENGLALVTDMTDAANIKLDAELALVSARINVIYNYYKLRYLSNTL